METFLVGNAVLTWIVLLFSVVLTIAVINRLKTVSLGQIPSSGALHTLNLNEPVPDFTTKTLSDDVVGLSDYAQRMFALIFVSPNCGPCREKMPSFNALAPKAKKHGIELLLVSVADKENTLALVREFNISLPVLLTTMESDFYKNFKVLGTPSYYIIDREGILRAASLGLDGVEWKNLVTRWETSS